MPCAARSASFPGVRVTRVRSLCAVFFNKSFVTGRPRSPEAPLITIRLMPFLSKHLGDPPRWEFSEISRFPVAVNSASGIPVQQVWAAIRAWSGDCAHKAQSPDPWRANGGLPVRRLRVELEYSHAITGFAAQLLRFDPHGVAFGRR